MSTRATLSVLGMTCQHCVSAVTQELTALDGVIDVAVELRPEEPSLVTVTSREPLSNNAVAVAVDEAGYELVLS